MKTRTVADFVPFVEITFAGAAPSTIQNAIRETIVTFMRETRAAADMLYLDAACGQVDHVLDTPECRRLVGVEAVYRQPPKGGAWTPDWQMIPMSDMTRSLAGWWMDDTGGPNATLWVYPRSASPARYAVRYSWAIGRDNCDVPEWIYEDYEPTITAGALAMLHANPQDQSSDLKFALMQNAAFTQGVAAARARRLAQYRGRKMRITTLNFYGG